MKKIIVLTFVMLLIGTIATAIAVTNVQPVPSITVPDKNVIIFNPSNREIYYPPQVKVIKWPWPPPQVIKWPPEGVINWTMPIMKPVPPIVIRPMPIFGGSVQQSIVDGFIRFPFVGGPIKNPIIGEPIEIPIVVPLE